MSATYRTNENQVFWYCNADIGMVLFPPIAGKFQTPKTRSKFKCHNFKEKSRFNQFLDCIIAIRVVTILKSLLTDLEFSPRTKLILKAVLIALLIRKNRILKIEKFELFDLNRFFAIF